MSVIVIGSGPAGMACAKALLTAGRQVVMIDEGKEARPAAAMPYRRRELTGWPVTAEEMEPHLRAVAEWMGVGAEVPLSAQGAALLETMRRHEARLGKAGMRFGRSRYATAPTVEAVRGDENFTLMPGYVVKRVEESASGVRVHMVDERGAAETMDGDRVLVAAGVMGTAEVMLRSLRIPDGTAKPVRIKESQGFVLPMLRTAGVRGGEAGALGEMFVEVMDERLSPHAIDVEVGTYKEGVARGGAGRVLSWGAVRSRVYLFEGEMHSDHGPVTEARLERRYGGGDELRLTLGERPEAAVILNGLRLKLAALRGATGLIGLGRWMRLRAGERGGSFPMAARPAGFGSDLLGRVGGMQRVHVVDASVLPEVAGMGVGLTVMANAWRIGAAVAEM